MSRITQYDSIINHINNTHGIWNTFHHAIHHKPFIGLISIKHFEKQI